MLLWGGDKTAFYFFTFGCYYTVKLDYKLERHADSCSVFAGFMVAPFLLYHAGASVVLLMWTFTFLDREPNSIKTAQTNMTGGVYSVNVCVYTGFTDQYVDAIVSCYFIDYLGI